MSKWFMMRTISSIWRQIQMREIGGGIQHSVPLNILRILEEPTKRTLLITSLIVGSAPTLNGSHSLLCHR